MYCSKTHLRAVLSAVLVSLSTPTLATLDSATEMGDSVTEMGSISGTVLSSDGVPVADADVEIVDLHRRLRVDARGTFRFENVPAGHHVLAVDSLRRGGAALEVVVEPGAELIVKLGAKLTVHRDSIVVSASPRAQRRLEVGSVADVVSAEELLLRSQPTLGATLSSRPGINETGFGAGASRPIVRGLGGDRVRMLEGGVGTGDLSEMSPDHAVTTETLTAERVEILRGPATLLYGSNAIGGVVNVLDESIPTHSPFAPLTGTLDLRLGSSNDERNGAVALRGRAGDWAWSASGLIRDTSDYKIPGFAQVGDANHEEDEDEEEEHEEEENPYGTLPNSDTETQQVGVGLSYFFGEHQEAGFLGVSVSGFDTNYGVPEGAHEHDENGEEAHEAEEDEEAEGHEEEGGVRIDMDRMRYDVKGAVTRPFGVFEGLKVRLGVTDYEHDEIEGSGEIGTHFENEAWEGRIELLQKERGRLSGAFGLQGGSRDFIAQGEEAFVPASTTDSLDAFVYEEVGFDSLSLQFGARWGSRDISVSDPDLPDRSFDGLSGSVGMVWSPGENALGISLARSVKFPSPEELYSFGAHAATLTFEVGSPTLDQETSLGLDLFYRHESERFRGEVAFFLTDFDHFIFPAFTGAEEDGFQVVEYRQQDAEFLGAEAELSVELLDSERTHLDLRFMGDLVEAELADGSNVPRIPPMRLGAGLDVKSGAWSGMTEVRWADDQTSTAESETSTASYTVVNASLGYRLMTDRVVYDFLLRGMNLTDEEVRLHTSYLKNLAPLPGTNVNLSLRLSF
jgi:iron complex outermembrane receptor protein